MSLGWAITDIIMASNALCFWLNRTWKILQTPKHRSILMSSGCVFSLRVLILGIRVYIHIGVGFGVACLELKAIPGPC